MTTTVLKFPTVAVIGGTICRCVCTWIGVLSGFLASSVGLWSEPHSSLLLRLSRAFEEDCSDGLSCSLGRFIPILSGFLLRDVGGVYRLFCNRAIYFTLLTHRVNYFLVESFFGAQCVALMQDSCSADRTLGEKVRSVSVPPAASPDWIPVGVGYRSSFLAQSGTPAPVGYVHPWGSAWIVDLCVKRTG